MRDFSCGTDEYVELRGFKCVTEGCVEMMSFWCGTEGLLVWHVEFEITLNLSNQSYFHI